MTELRDKIIGEMVFAGKTAIPLYDVADAILNLPSGLVATKDCIHETPPVPMIYGWKQPHCIFCNDIGTITRDISLSEAIEILKGIVNNYYLGCGPVLHPALNLPSGERVVKQYD